MDSTSKMRNLVIITLLIFVFSMFIAHYFMTYSNPIESFANTEYYDCRRIQKKIDDGKFQGSQTNLIPCKPILYPHDRWFTRYDKNTSDTSWHLSEGRQVSTLKKKIVNDQGEETTTNIEGAYMLKISDIKGINGQPLESDYMTFSFWIYIHGTANYWRPILQIGNHENGYWLSERSPGIWLWPWSRRSLHIRRSTDADYLWHINENAGADFFTESLNSLPLRKPAYVTIVFSSKTYKIFINGQCVQTWENNDVIREAKIIDDSDINDVKKNPMYVWIGDRYREGEPSYYLRKMQFFPVPLKDDEVMYLYCNEKFLAESNPSFGKGAYEGFGNRKSFMKKIDTFQVQFGVKNEVNMLSNNFQFKSDKNPLGEQSKKEQVASEDEMKSVMRSDENDGLEFKNEETHPNGVIYKKVILDKFHFPKLHNNKKLNYIKLRSRNKEYIQWTKDFETEGTSGLTFMCWYRPSSMKPFENSQKNIQKHYNNALEQYRKDKRWTYNTWKHTYEAWFPAEGSKRYHSFNNNRAWARLFDFGNGPGKDNIIAALWDKSLTFHCYSDKYGKQSKFYNVPMIAEGNDWYHYAITIQKNNGKTDSVWKVYHNGTLYNTYNGLNYPGPGLREFQYIGKSNWGHDPYYNGDIGDFRIYKKEFSQDEIERSMNELPNAYNDLLDFRGFN